LYKKIFALILCFITAFAVVIADAAVKKDDMAYFVFDDGGVEGETNPALAGDGDLKTFWTTVSEQKPGMKFIIDKFAFGDIGKIVLKNNRGGEPGVFNVYVTRYRENWGEPVLKNIEGSEAGDTVINLPTEIYGRFIMLELADGTGKNPNPWEISEVEIYNVSDNSRGVKDFITVKDGGTAEPSLPMREKLLRDIGLPFDEMKVTTLKRSEFIDLVMRFMLMFEEGTGQENFPVPSFNDVAPSHKSYSNIEKALKLGLISEAGEFRPNAPIDIREAVKITVCALGHKLPAAAKGGWPTGYLMTASDLGILKNIDASPHETTKEDAVIMFFNALEAELMTLESVGAEFTMTKGNTAGYVWHGVYKVRGIITVTSASSLSGLSSLSKGRVIMNGNEYSVGETNAESYLGYSAEAYVRDDKNGGFSEILYITPYKNATVTIPAENVESVDGYTVYYYNSFLDNNGKKQKAALEGGAYMLYNGGIHIPFDSAGLKPADGSLTLIDNDADGNYEIAAVNDYVNYFVGSVNKRDMFITDAYFHNNLDLDDVHGVKTVNIYKDGEKIGLSALNEKNIVSVGANKTVIRDGVLTVDTDNADVLNLYVSDKTVRGSVDSYTESEGILEIDGRSYYLSAGFLGQCGLGNAKLPALGGNAVCYLDYNGKIAAIEITGASDKKYGYMTKIGYDKTKIDKFVKARIFSDDGKFYTYPFADKVTVDMKPGKIDTKEGETDGVTAFMSSFYGTATKNVPRLYPDGTPVLDANGKPETDEETSYEFIPQLIGFSLNADGQISAVDTKIFEEGYENRDMSINYYSKMEYVYNTWRGQLMLNSDTRGYPNIFTGSMRFFAVPSNPDSAVEEDYAVRSNGYLVHDGYYNLEVYRITEFNEGQLGVIYVSAGGGGANVGSSYVLVDKISRALDRDGTEMIKFKGANGRNDVNYFFKSENVLIEKGLYQDGNVLLKRGDIVKLAVAGDYIETITRVFSIDNFAASLTPDGRYYKDERNLVGMVYNQKGTKLMITSTVPVTHPNVEKELEAFELPNYATVYDQKANEVRRATADDIISYKKQHNENRTSIVFIKSIWADIQNFIIINLDR
jgi:hypothetical protein